MELMLSDKFLSGKAFSEHHQYYFSDIISSDDLVFYEGELYFKGNQENDFCCFRIDNCNKPKTSYFVGIDWLNKLKNKAIYVQPKLNKGEEQLDYIKMLFSLINHPETLEHIDDIYEIKWDDEYIEIENKQDHLTPLLVVQFLQVLRQIVRKGLKKTYYKVERNLYGKVKGKVMVASTIKHNLVKNKPLNTYCSFDEFGVNGLENRLLKKALVFVQRYLNANKINTQAGITNLLNYISSAFAEVSDEVSLHEVKHARNNAFYKDYENGLKLAKLILKRFGYNITNTQQIHSIKTPPFWIDMSILFELYVLGLLKDRFQNFGEVKYQFSSYGNKLDYLLNTPTYKMVVDAKYKEVYHNGFKNEDIRQVSGYARLKAVYDDLDKKYNEIIDCLIIYPNQEHGLTDLKIVDLTDENNHIEYFVQVFKVGLKLPLIQ